MQAFDLLGIDARAMGLHGIDGLALAWFVVCFTIAAFLLRLGRSRASLTGAVQGRRIAWMGNMAARDNRMMDIVLLQMLSSANTFFASTSVILLGGLAAILGSGERVQALLERLPFVARATPMLFEIKLLFLMALFIYAFFKFAWAFRLTHYTAIMIGAAPIAKPEGPSPECTAHAERVAILAGLSAEHANTGLRTYYFAIAGTLWFLHPAAFMAATAWVLAILIRREFFSRSRRAMGPG